MESRKRHNFSIIYLLLLFRSEININIYIYVIRVYIKKKKKQKKNATSRIVSTVREFFKRTTTSYWLYVHHNEDNVLEKR